MPLPLTDRQWSHVTEQATTARRNIITWLSEAYAAGRFSGDRLGDLINEVQHQGGTSTAMYAVATHLIELAHRASPEGALAFTDPCRGYLREFGQSACCPLSGLFAEDFAASASEGAKMLSPLLPLATDFDTYKWAVAGIAGFIGHHSFARFLDGLDLYEGQFHHVLLGGPFPKEE